MKEFCKAFQKICTIPIHKLNQYSAFKAIHTVITTAKFTDNITDNITDKYTDISISF